MYTKIRFYILDDSKENSENSTNGEKL